MGPRLLASRLGRRVGPVRLRRVESLLRRGGGRPAGGPLHRRGQGRAPGLAGTLGLRYRTFALWTGVAATGWAVAHVLAGYVAGAGWRHVHHLGGRVGIVLAVAVVAVLAAARLARAARGSESY